MHLVGVVGTNETKKLIRSLEELFALPEDEFQFGQVLIAALKREGDGIEPMRNDETPHLQSDDVVRHQTENGVKTLSNLPHSTLERIPGN